MPIDVQIWWLALAGVAVALTCFRRHWAGLWLGGALVAAAWVYAELASVAVPPHYYPIGELGVGLAIAGAGVLVALLGAVYVMRRGRPRARLGMVAAFGLAGLAAGYFVPALTSGLDAGFTGHGDEEEVWVRVFDTPVHRELGPSAEAFEGARAYRGRIVLPACAAAGCVVGIVVGGLAVRAGRRRPDLG